MTAVVMAKLKSLILAIHLFLLAQPYQDLQLERPI